MSQRCSSWSHSQTLSKQACHYWTCSISHLSPENKPCPNQISLPKTLPLGSNQLLQYLANHLGCQLSFCSGRHFLLKIEYQSQACKGRSPVFVSRLHPEIWSDFNGKDLKISVYDIMDQKSFLSFISYVSTLIESLTFSSWLTPWVPSSCLRNSATHLMNSAKSGGRAVKTVEMMYFTSFTLFELNSIGTSSTKYLAVRIQLSCLQLCQKYQIRK